MTADADVLDKLFTVLNGLRNGAIVVAIVQALAALLLIANTVQVTAYTRRTETGIMRLVGASRWYIQFPFVARGGDRRPDRRDPRGRRAGASPRCCSSTGR